MRRLLPLLFVLFPLVAWADDVDIARQRFNEGVHFFDGGQYDKARAAFLQAWVLKKHPAVLLNLAQSCLRSRHEAEAARYFQEYLRDPNATDSGKSIAEHGLADARARDARLDLRAPPNVEVFVDDQSVGVGATIADVDPGTHAVRAGSASQSVTVGAGALTIVPLGGDVKRPSPPPESTAPPPTSAPPARPLAEMLGGAGESCRARSDCEANLKCLDQVCVDANAKVPPKPAAKSFALEGVHGFAGISLRTGPALLMTANGSGAQSPKTLEGTFAFALRAGVLANRNELAIEIAPFTDVYYINVAPLFTGPAFGAVVTYGYNAALYETPNVGVYWPIRFGLGVLAGGNNTAGLAYLQYRMDLVGFTLRFSRVMIDLDLLSFRYLFTDTSGQTIHIFSWRAGLNASVMF